MTDLAIDRIRQLEHDSGLAPGSESSLLGPALDSVRGDPSDDNLAWWTGAYAFCAWASNRPGAWERQSVLAVWDSPEEMVLSSGDDWAGWSPLLAWRTRAGLTQTRAAEVAGVKMLAWQRWESGQRAVPQWLSDVLAYRWGDGL